MQKILWSILGLWLCGLLAAAGAESFQLVDGTTVSGNIVSFTDNGIIFRLDDDKYTDRLPWLKFTQASLKQLAQNPKIAPLVEPFIEPPPPPAARKKEINISEPARLDRPASASFFGALFSSPIGIVALLLIYAGNIFAGYEVAVFRNKPVGVVTAVSALLPILGPVIFLSMVPQTVEAVEYAEETAAPAAEPEPHRFAVPHAETAAPAPQEEIHIVAGGFSGESPPQAEQPQAEIFQRGQFMFNRRFFETKFAGFFGIVRSESDRNKILMVKIPAALLTVERISRISANDIHFEVVQGGQRQEITVPFADIQQIQLKYKS